MGPDYKTLKISLFIYSVKYVFPIPNFILYEVEAQSMDKWPSAFWSFAKPLVRSISLGVIVNGREFSAKNPNSIA